MIDFMSVDLLLLLVAAPFIGSFLSVLVLRLPYVVSRPVKVTVTSLVGWLLSLAVLTSIVLAPRQRRHFP